MLWKYSWANVVMMMAAVPKFKKQKDKKEGGSDKVEDLDGFDELSDLNFMNM